MASKLKLTWFDAKKDRHEVELRGERLTIGRVDADVQLEDDQLSRRHAAIEREGDGFVLVDLESRNGTFVEGSNDRVKRRRLADGETILVGKARLRVAILAGEAAAAVKAEGATVIAQIPSDLPIVITVVSGLDRGQVFSPPKEKITLGRGPTNDVPLNDPGLSRLHATIKREKGGYAIYDENSRNGVYVGSPPRRIYHGILAHGDTVRLGGETQIRVEVGGGAEVAVSDSTQTFAVKFGEATFALSMPSMTMIRPREPEAAPAATGAVPAADALPTLRFRIVAGYGTGRVLEVPAGADEVTIGRSAAATLRIEDPSVSGRHCSVTRTPDGWVLKDTVSRNGTFLGDSTERVESVPLRGGEQIRLGEARLAVELGEAGAKSAVEEGTQLTRVGAAPPASPPAAPAPAPAAVPDKPAAKPAGGKAKAEPIAELAKSAEAKQRISRIMKGVSLRPVRVPGTLRQWASLGMMLLAALVSLGFSMRYPALLSAGPLHVEHAELESREKCGSCHVGFEGIGTRQTQLAMSGSCVTADCHASALANEPGVQDTCLDCHTDHRGRNFPIAGGKDVCWSCHLGRDEPRDFDARPMRIAATVAGGTAAIAKLAEPFRKVEIGLRFAHAAHDAETKGDAKYDNCTGCHANVDDGRTFAMPGHAQCIECHEKAVSADEEVAKRKKGPDCLECHTREDGEMQELPPTAFAWARFAHRDHTEELCQSCHAPVWEESAYESVVRSPDVYVMTMDACVTCHETKRATVACLDCHRSHHSFDGGQVAAAAAAPPARGFDRFLIGLATLVLGGFAYLYADMRVARRYLEAEQEAPAAAKASAGAPAAGEAPKGEIMPFPTVDVEACISCSSCYNSCPKQVLAGDDHGKSTVVNPDSCIALEGCAVCEQGCPTGAIRVSTAPLVRTVERPDTDEHLEAKPMPGLFFVGEVIGAALIKSAVNQGTDVVRYIKDKKKRVAAPAYDVIVVGAGPAGLGAGLEAKATGLRYLVLERDTVASTIRAYPRDKAVLAEPVKVPLYGKLPMMDAEKDELIAVWEAVVKATGLEVQQHEEVSEIRREGELLKVKTAKGEYAAANVVLAIGTRGNPRRLGCGGEEPSRVSYNLIDAGDWKGKKVLVVGGGDSAIEAAVALAKAEGTTVWLSYRKNAFARVKKRNTEQIEELAKAGRIEIIWESSVTEVGADGAVLKLAAGPKTLDCVHVFALIGADPPRGWIEKIGVPFVEKQELVIAWS